MWIFLEKGVEVKRKDGLGYIVLYYVVRKGYFDVVWVLLDCYLGCVIINVLIEEVYS